MACQPAVQVVSDQAMLARVGADWFVRAMQDAIAVRGRAAVALCGGDTPRGMYAKLAGPPHTTRLDLSLIDFFMTDERCVPPGDPLSNFTMLDELLLSPAGVPRANIHRIRGELDAEAAADDYERRLRARFPASDLPALDLVVLGIGDDGHIASMFAGSPALSETSRWAAAVQGGPPVRDRVTLTLPAINSAGMVLFLASGAGKADAVKRALAGDANLPAARISPTSGHCRWLLTPAAAGRQ